MGRTMSSEEYQELGREYYKEKQYDKAVKAFTNGIEASTNPTTKLFDYRAASYDKLGNFNSALKDGREMIRLDKRDVKGYLRTASILQKVDRSEKALDIYKYGMKNVPVGDDAFKFLQQLHDKLTRQLSPSRAVDPLTVFPVELVEMIMGYLTFRNVVNCLRVSQGWKAYLTKCPNLWLELNMSGARRDVSRVFIRNAVYYSNYQIQRVIVHRFRHLDVLRNLATACKNLTHLEILSGSQMSETIVEVAQCALNLKSIAMHNTVSLDTVAQVLRFRPTLERAQFMSVVGTTGNLHWSGPFPNLRTVELNHTQAQERPNVAALFEETPRLTSLTLTNFQSPNVMWLSRLPLVEVIFKNFGRTMLLRFPTTLERLTLEFSTPFLVPNTANGLNNVSWQVAENSDIPKLSSLNLANFLDLNAAFLSVLLDHHVDQTGTSVKYIDGQTKAVPLRHLSIKDSTFDTAVPGGRTLGELLQASPRLLSRDLQTLALSSMTLDDEDIEDIVTHAPCLTSVDVSNTKITGAGVKLLVDKLPALESLVLDNCTRISSRDVVRYAESKGVRVSMKMVQTTGGRKVRYG
ncbi:hypothetical protein K491DRAFT_617280 [Lophiostoma macrostomum CBS 122681]|uniref:F-box domain-containing protein n=1 Tax=Lophiostoma macrostomum CBS 122681 TaxID=1314788 RepID=A0A6A6TQZ6_9PLEO|nr:hypothetical protein K491DRAFT_617280 [Lophiostoma macrostomum CBS 122681]